MSSRLPSLPVEILRLLMNNLEPTNLFALRLVCRELSRKTLHDFVRTYFAIVRTDLTPKSLQRLHDISESENLAQYVKDLRITHFDGALGHGFQWPRHPLGHLAHPLIGADLLRDILVNKLVQCSSFCIDGYDEVRQREEMDFLTPGDAVGIIFSLIADTSLAIRSFKIESMMGSTGRLDTKRLLTASCRQPQFIASWAHLEALILNNRITCDQYDWVLDLISNAPRLRELSLRFYSEYPNRTSGFTERLNSAHHFRWLQAFSLESAVVTAETIVEFLLQSHNTLRALFLRCVAIKGGGTWATVLKLMKGNLPCLASLLVFALQEHQADGWSRVVFSKLAEYPALPGSEERRPGDGRLRSDSRRVNSLERPVQLTYQWLYGKRRVVSADYQGPGMDNFLDVLRESAENV